MWSEIDSRNIANPLQIWNHRSGLHTYTHTHTHTRAHNGVTNELLPRTAAVSRSFRSRGFVSHRRFLSDITPLPPRTPGPLLPLRVSSVSSRSETPRGRIASGLSVGFARCSRKAEEKNLALFRMWIAVHAPMATLTASSSTDVRSPSANIVQPKETCARGERPAGTIDTSILECAFCSREWSAAKDGLRYILYILDCWCKNIGRNWRIDVQVIQGTYKKNWNEIWSRKKL